MGNNWKAIYQAEVLTWTKTNPNIEKVIWIQHNNDASDQITGIRDFISKRVHGIVIDCANATALAPVYKEASDAGIPLVTCTDPIDSTNYVSATIPALTQMSYHQAKILFGLLGGTGKLIRFIGMKGSSYDEMVQRGYDLALAETPGMQVVATGVGLWDYTESKKAMTELIPALPAGGVDGLLTSSGQMTFGVIDAMIDANIDISKMILTGDPTNGPLLIAKQKGMKYIAGGGNVWEGAEATKILCKILQGLPVQKMYPLPMRVWPPEEAANLGREDLPRLVDMDTTLAYSDWGRKYLTDLFASLGFK